MFVFIRVMFCNSLNYCISKTTLLVFNWWSEKCELPDVSWRKPRALSHAWNHMLRWLAPRMHVRNQSAYCRQQWEPRANWQSCATTQASSRLRAAFGLYFGPAVPSSLSWLAWPPPLYESQCETCTMLYNTSTLLAGGAVLLCKHSSTVRGYAWLFPSGLKFGLFHLLFQYICKKLRN